MNECEMSGCGWGEGGEVRNAILAQWNHLTYLRLRHAKPNHHQYFLQTKTLVLPYIRRGHSRNAVNGTKAREIFGAWNVHGCMDAWNAWNAWKVQGVMGGAWEVHGNVRCM